MPIDPTTLKFARTLSRIKVRQSGLLIDELLALVEAIADHIRLTRLPGSPEAAWVSISQDPVVSSEALEQHRVFTSVLSVTYRVRR